ncbi:MAG: LPS-assembly protein LptD [Bacteroidaceae bacterium]|nr:LPS-assembly protein LptD [Bacteroidaceae bacterium]
MRIGFFKIFLLSVLLTVVALAMPVNAHVVYPASLNGFSLALDSLFTPPHIMTDSLEVDSFTVIVDSVEEKGRKEPLDAPVYYECTDSMVWSRTGNAYLYGNSKVTYDNVELTADVITMNMDSSVVHAMGRKDSLGADVGMPIFKDGSTPYESDRMSYNFKTKKGFISNVFTQQGDGFIMGGKAKKDSTDVFYSQDGKYTTCDAEHPHFYIQLTRAKVRPKKDVVSGPLYLVIEDVPLPVALPFGYFPFTSSYSSGIIMPTYGDEMERGFYLRDGGYYFAISDKLDLRLTGEIYTKGSWGLGAASTYARRYRYSGSVDFSYLVTKEGEKGLPDYAVGKNFRLQWSHRQDPKARPNSNFSASVNFATASYERSNLNSLYNPILNSQSMRTSSVSYSHTFPSIGLSISATMNIAQNIQDSTLSLTLPNLSVSLSKKYPFKRKKRAGDERWYEKISLSYSGQMSNSISTKEDKVFDSNLVRDWRNGFKHNIPISATFQLFDVINVTPSLNYTERWYLKKVNQHWDEASGSVVRDTINGFNRVYNYNFSISANTTLYGFYQPAGFLKKSRIHTVRHVFKPSVSFTYAPDFGSDRYGYYDSYVYTDKNGEVRTVEYSPYQNSLYGVPGKGKTGSISFSVSNNVEMKWRAKNDSLKKVSIIDELGASISYNLAAKTRPWSNLSTRLRLKLSKNYTFSLNATWATYAYEFNERGQVVVGERTEWSYGRFGRFQGMSQNISYTFNNKTYGKIKDWLLGSDDENGEDGEIEDEAGKEQLDKKESLRAGKSKKTQDADVDDDGYMPFKLPWSLTVSYGIVMAENTAAEINVKTMRYPYKFTQNLNFSGNIGISDNWNMNFTSGYNFEFKKLTTTMLNISRDLHCFEMSCGIVLSPYTSFNFSFRATSQMLADALKFEKRSSASSNVEWYND